MQARPGGHRAQAASDPQGLDAGEAPAGAEEQGRRYGQGKEETDNVPHRHNPPSKVASEDLAPQHLLTQRAPLVSWWLSLLTAPAASTPSAGRSRARLSQWPGYLSSASQTLKRREISQRRLTGQRAITISGGCGLSDGVSLREWLLLSRTHVRLIEDQPSRAPGP